MLIIGLLLRDGGGVVDSPAYEEHDLCLLSKNNKYCDVYKKRRIHWIMAILKAPFQVFWNKNKKEPKEMPSRLITHLVVVFSRQLEILVTALWLTTYLLTVFNFHTFFS